jgi:2-methylaconitate cis-trans-isomerase PrpF
LCYTPLSPHSLAKEPSAEVAVREIASTWMRGGTSKCWVFEHERLQVPGRGVDEVLLRLYGSPDPRQVDGVGGATSTTSKAVILARSTRPGIDVDYTFAQVAVDERRVDWGSNCGNCSAVVGLYAVRRGWVAPQDGTTPVRVHNTNTGQLIVQQVPTPGRVLDEDGTTRIPGVSFPGTAVRMWFVDPGGRSTGALLPTGRALDLLDGSAGPVPATMIDAGAPVVVMAPGSVGLHGRETPAEIDARPDVLAELESLRRQAAVRMGLVVDAERAERAVPKVALVTAPRPGEDADLVVRMLSMGRTHPALAITGSVAMTMAAREPGTIVPHSAGEVLRLLTPAGVVETRTREIDGRPAVGVLRTARRLADATLALPDATPTAEIGAARASQDVRNDHEEVVWQ